MIMGIFELFQHEKNGKFLERLQTFRKSLSICGRAGNQVFMWFVTFWGCPVPLFSTRGQIWCENETFAEINLLHKIASNSETVWSWEKFRTIPESCWHCLSTCTGCAAITSTIWLLQGVLWGVSKIDPPSWRAYISKDAPKFRAFFSLYALKIMEILPG